MCASLYGHTAAIVSCLLADKRVDVNLQSKVGTSLLCPHFRVVEQNDDMCNACVGWVDCAYVCQLLYRR